MKKSLFLGLALMTAFAFLTVSCNQNRFDFSELESIETNGHWSLPVGTLSITLEQVLNQLGENDVISYDETGDIIVSYRYAWDTVVIGSSFMGYDSIHNEVKFTSENPYPYVLEEPVEGVLYFEDSVYLESEEVLLQSAKIRSGHLSFQLTDYTGDIREYIVGSNNILDANGVPFRRSIDLHNENVVDLAGYRFVTGGNNTLYFFYEIHYVALDYVGPEFVFTGNLDINDLKVQELSGYVNNYVSPYSIDTSFQLPLENVEGAIDFTGANLKILQRNSFGLPCRLQIDTAELYGEGVDPYLIFDEDAYPLNLDLAYSLNYTEFMDEDVHLGLSTNHNRARASGAFILNPEGTPVLVTLFDTATMGVAVEVNVPLKFNISDVTYNDTVDMDLSEIENTDILSEVRLTLTFDSELPVNLEAQIYTTDPETGAVNDSLLGATQTIRGAFVPGTSERTNVVATLTQDFLNKLMANRHLLVRLGLDTEDNNVSLNVEDGIRVTVKMDVIYDGEIDLN